MVLNECPVCDGRKSNNYRICKGCAIEHGVIGLPQSQWPEWLLYLARFDDVIRKRRNRGIKDEVPMDPLILEQIIDNNGNILQ